MKQLIILFLASLLSALLTVAASLFGWWLGASLPLNISNGSKQVIGLVLAAFFTWGCYVGSCKVLVKIRLKQCRNSNQ